MYGKGSFRSPAETQGKVVFNATLSRREIANRRHSRKSDYQFEVAGCDQTNLSHNTLSIYPHELCYRRTDEHSRARAWNDTEFHVMSALNGFSIMQNVAGVKTITDTNDKNYGKIAKAVARKQIQFAGVAANPAIFRDDGHGTAHEMNCVVQVGGVCTIQNTGSQKIHVGDLVIWDLPDDENSGQNMHTCKEKQFLITKPFMQFVANETTEVVDDWAEAMRKSKKAAFDLASEYFLEERSRVIGRAMSSAASGDVFDILLGHYAV